MKEKLQVRNVLYFGDFNFPNISWPSGEIYSSKQGERENKSDENKQWWKVLELNENVDIDQSMGMRTQTLPY